MPFCPKIKNISPLGKGETQVTFEKEKMQLAEDCHKTVNLRLSRGANW